MKQWRLSENLLKRVFFLALLLVFTVFFMAKFDSAFAVQDVIQIADTLYRVDDEIMSKTPYGRYYSNMFWQHNTELIEIFEAHPDQIDDMFRVTMLNLPPVEALLDGNGDTVTISERQVDEIEVMFTFIASVASDELRTDIEREQQRTPLQDFVGLTMNEAMIYIEEAWERDFPE